jgi:hypothetical protein
VTVLDKTPARAHRSTLEELLKQMEIGDQLTWQELSEACGKAPTVALYCAVDYAKRQLRAAHGMHFETIKGVGIERLSDIAVATRIVPNNTRKIQRAALRGIKTVNAIDLTKLDKDARLTAAAHGSYLAMVAENAKPKVLVAKFAPRDLAQIAKESLDQMK